MFHGGSLSVPQTGTRWNIHATMGLTVQRLSIALNCSIKASEKEQLISSGARQDILTRVNALSQKLRRNAHFRRTDTCALAVSATKPMALTWDQISAAFDTLFTFCVDHPFMPPRSGHASYSNNPQLQLFGWKAKRGDMSGLNALPRGIIISLWKHGGNGENMACELALYCVDSHSANARHHKIAFRPREIAKVLFLHHEQYWSSKSIE